MVLVVALLAATATAFALTEGLKLEPSPILGTDVEKVFSPVCGCPSEQARISFRLREADILDVALIDSGGTVVARPVQGERFDRGRVVIRWDGLDADGEPLPEAEYRPRVHLREERRTIVLPNPIEIDVTPPVVESLRLSRRVFSPDGDRRADRVILSYELDEDGRGLLYVNGRRRGLTRFPRPSDRMVWNGKVDGRALPAAIYRLQLSAQDRAGNLARRTERGCRADPLRGARPRSRPHAGGSPIRDSRLVGRAARALDARAAHRLRSTGDAAHPSATPEGAVHLAGVRERPHKRWRQSSSVSRCHDRARADRGNGRLPRTHAAPPRAAPGAAARRPRRLGGRDRRTGALSRAGGPNRAAAGGRGGRCGAGGGRRRRAPALAVGAAARDARVRSDPDPARARRRGGEPARCRSTR